MKFRDREAVQAVYSSNQPKMTAKHWEKTSRREDWGSMILDAMKFCLQTKCEQCEEFRKALSDSKGHYIVEDQTSFPKKSPDAWGVKLVGNEYVGPNVLGRLLMELRDKGQRPTRRRLGIYRISKERIMLYLNFMVMMQKTVGEWSPYEAVFRCQCGTISFSLFLH